MKVLYVDIVIKKDKAKYEKFCKDYEATIKVLKSEYNKKVEQMKKVKAFIDEKHREYATTIDVLKKEIAKANGAAKKQIKTDKPKKKTTKKKPSLEKLIIPKKKKVKKVKKAKKVKKK